MRFVEDLIYYDGPLLSLFKNDNGAPVIRVWLDCNDDFNLWADIESTYPTMVGYLTGKISLTELARQCVQMVQYKQSANCVRFDDQPLDIKEYLRKYGGTEDNYLSDNHKLDLLKKFDLT